MIRKLIYISIGVLVLIQFIRPGKNSSSVISPNDITLHYTVPDTVTHILKRACYDCHSNNTVYPWYSHVQPVAWWLAHHINEGKEELNFSEFNAYSVKRKARKMKEIVEWVEMKEMPLSSYSWVHKDARLSDREIALITDWALNFQSAEPSSKIGNLEKSN